MSSFRPISKLPAFLTSAAVLPALLLAFAVQTAKAESDSTEIELISQPTVSAIVIHGPIYAPLADHAAEMLARIPNGRPVVIDLDSPGGDLDEGEKLIALLDKAKKDHRVTTYVANGHICLSMCIAVFMTGQRRAADHASVWMIHAAHAFGSPLPLPEPTKQYLHDLISHGVSKRWLEEIERKHKIFSQPRQLWLTGADLTAQHTNIATVIHSGLETVQPVTAMSNDAESQ